jgi:geranylgeranyl reductase family protein
VIEAAIIGAGPAGAYCAFSMAREGLKPILFDHSHPREKPCGGALSPYAQEAFPFLKRLPIIHAEATRVRIVYAGRRQFTTAISGKFIIASRRRLDRHILDMATHAGAELIEEKVAAVERSVEGWKIKTRKDIYRARILIGADGVNSVLRKATVGAFESADLGLCFGYLTAPINEECVTLKPLPHRRGYMWIFPRKDHMHVGIAADLNRSSNLRTELDQFLRGQYPKIKLIQTWAALVPRMRTQTFRKRVAGSNWILIGDAAGHVESITGEGILYALTSAQLAAEAVVEGKPEAYDLYWRQVYGQILSYSAALRSLAYHKYFCVPYFILNVLLAKVPRKRHIAPSALEAGTTEAEPTFQMERTEEKYA